MKALILNSSKNEPVTPTYQNAMRKTMFGPAQTSTASRVQEQLAGHLQHGPPSAGYVKPKPHQREVDEGEIREAAPSVEPAPTIMVSCYCNFLCVCTVIGNNGYQSFRFASSLAT